MEVTYTFTNQQRDDLCDALYAARQHYTEILEDGSSDNEDPVEAIMRLQMRRWTDLERELEVL